jgi:hypothetical protein
MFIRVKQFEQLAGPKPELKNIVHSDSRLKKNIYRCFGPFCASLVSKCAKSAILTAKLIFSTNLDMGVKRRQI